ncbi:MULTISPECIES: plasmid replication protein RepC [Rhizobium]|uniref:plasmid replication protein RepC n=1 Tax=Rhizobium TaxID=379 RepID=UPI0007E92A58|nr:MULTISPECIES: plasmid replication protein RepC [Rhizobium]ANK95564.1 replication initiation protein RepC 4-1 [Rhizobium sp. N6212]ANL01616.1 replication initiation protein RepC 4-1 [Rhizobium sp. N621]ANL07744.1 replication initiation protein RepC 4-1 [Rhizobium esperanzae]ANL13915.1 replication initiation protein RepC 5-1 [Rhizobium sp. N1341]ANL25897.1 replication initiation protein RepC 4-1 [Rhizobium sp. N113]
MESDYVTTPFGRRPMTLAMLLKQRRGEAIAAGTTRNKWKLFRSVCEARAGLDVTDRALTVLDALLTFYPEDELSSEKGLVVFPSNAQLSLRARGMAAATLRRHLAVLVEAGLIARKDSPNGKRYVRRGREGGIDEAYGFSLAPLLARAGEIETMAARIAADRQMLRGLKERLTICRRDIAKLISAAVEEAVPGDWACLSSMFQAILQRIPKAANLENLAPILEELEATRENIVNLLEMHEKMQMPSASESQIERHIQNSNPESISEFEPGLETGQGARPEMQADRSHRSKTTPDDKRLQAQANGGEGPRFAGRPRAEKPKSFPLTMVLQACPDISDYGPGGAIGSRRDLMTAAVVVHRMLGVSPSAYEQACSVMGPENTATVIACILQRGGCIHSPGGYLRDLTRRAERGEFALGPMLMAILRAKDPSVAKLS